MFAGLCLFAAAWLSGCSTDYKPAGPADYLKVTVTTCPYQINPLDAVTVTFADGTTKVLIVDHEGMLDTGHGPEKAAGKSVAELDRWLREAFPNAVKIDVHEFKDNRISVLGEVFHQLHTELGNGPMRVMDAIAAANGFTSLADKRHVRLVRENAGVVETYEIDFRQLLRGENMRQNILVRPGDVITVPRDFL